MLGGVSIEFGALRFEGNLVPVKALALLRHARPESGERRPLSLAVSALVFDGCSLRRDVCSLRRGFRLQLLQRFPLGRDRLAVLSQPGFGRGERVVASVAVFLPHTKGVVSSTLLRLPSFEQRLSSLQLGLLRLER